MPNWTDNHGEQSKVKGAAQRIGILLLVAGIARLVWGFRRHGSFGNKLSRAFDGSIDAKTIVVLAGGSVCTLLGLIKLNDKEVHSQQPNGTGTTP